MITLALLLAVAVWLVLPFVPALHEAFRQNDAGSLPVSDRYVEDLRTPYDAPIGPSESVTDEVPGLGTLRLKAGTKVARNVAAGTTLEVEGGVVLRGSAEAGRRAWLGSDVRFERVHAPTIDIGVVLDTPPARRPPTFEVNLGVELLANRALVPGDLTLPARGRLDATLVVTGDLVIQDGAVVEGDVKAHGDIVVEPGARVGGNLFASGSLTIGDWAEVGGAAVTEQTLCLGRGARVGRPDAPTTASGRTVIAAAGACVHGTLWAEEEGRTVDRLEGGRSTRAVLQAT